MSEQQTAIPPDRRLTAAPSEALPVPTDPPGAASDLATPASKLLEALKWAVSFPAMLGAFLVGRVFYEGRAFVVDPDVWWHIKNGQNILATHHWPTVDPYSFTVNGTPWLSYEWLGDVAIGFVGRFGLQALDALLIVLASIIMLAVYYLAALRSGNSKASFVSALLLSIFAFGNFTLRPQMLGFFLLLICLTLLERFRQGSSRALWFLPPLFLLWVNMHGSWVIGLAVVVVTLVCGLLEFHIGTVEGIRWTQEQRIQLESALLASIAMIPFTPYGTQLAAYPFTVASSLPLNVANIKEWLPMPFNLAAGKLFLALIVAVFVLQAFYRFTFRLEEWVLALGGIVMACLHVRFVLLFVPFFAPMLATMLARFIPGYYRAKDKFVLNAALMSSAAVATVWYFPSRADLDQKVERVFPSRAVSYLHSHPLQGPLFNTYGYGGYLIAYLPEQKVFIDGRGDLYEVGGAFSDYLQATNLKPAAFSVLKSYGIRACILDRGEPLAVVLGNHPDWKRVYSDDTSVILVRKTPWMGPPRL
jgi:hypothetical protein